MMESIEWKKLITYPSKMEHENGNAEWKVSHAFRPEELWEIFIKNALVSMIRVSRLFETNECERWGNSVTLLRVLKESCALEFFTEKIRFLVIETLLNSGGHRRGLASALGMLLTDLLADLSKKTRFRLQRIRKNQRIQLEANSLIIFGAFPSQ